MENIKRKISSSTGSTALINIEPFDPDYVRVLKPSYKSIDGTIKKSLTVTLPNGNFYGWVAPKNDYRI